MQTCPCEIPDKPNATITPRKRDIHFPPTPESTPSRSTKRKFSTALEAYPDPSTPSRKRNGGQPKVTEYLPSPRKQKTHYRCELTPYFSILYRPEPVPIPDVSAIELKRAAESVLAQVSWAEVQQDVASNRYGTFYRKVITGILQEKLDQLHSQESRLEDPKVQKEEDKVSGEGSEGQERDTES